MKLTSRALSCAALALAFLLGTASPSDAQASPVLRGNGTYLGQNLAIKDFAFAVNRLPHSKVQGHATIIEQSSQGLFQMDVTSMMSLGDAVAVAGPITTVVNTPPQFVVGATAFFVVHDNGDGTLVPDEIALGVAPLFLGDLTIQEIIMFIGPPPPQAFAPVLTGDIKIF